MGASARAEHKDRLGVFPERLGLGREGRNSVPLATVSQQQLNNKMLPQECSRHSPLRHTVYRSCVAEMFTMMVKQPDVQSGAVQT